MKIGDDALESKFEQLFASPSRRGVAFGAAAPTAFDAQNGFQLWRLERCDARYSLRVQQVRGEAALRRYNAG
jgi:hypothetical protein